MKYLPNLKIAVEYARNYLLNTGQIVKGHSWQGTKAPAPMYEAMDLTFKCPMPQSLQDLIEINKPSTPWAENHFQERISGIPYNPPPSHEHWPFGKDNNKTFTSDDKFDHTYPERFWPKYADRYNPEMGIDLEYLEESGVISRGIRFNYGDLNDVINQLRKDPTTRQAFLPIWFPEDTGALGGKGRVPCTIGYHFMIRQGFLHITYWMRSCDYLRHFKDDLYLAVRLAQHVTASINTSWDPADNIKLGLLKFHAVSFHAFEFEKNKI